MLQNGLDLRMSLGMRVERRDLGLGRPAQRGRTGGQGGTQQAGQQQGATGPAQPDGPSGGQSNPRPGHTRRTRQTGVLKGHSFQARASLAVALAGER